MWTKKDNLKKMNQKAQYEKEMFKNFANKCKMGCANHIHCIISAEQRAVCEPIFLSLAVSAFLWLTLALSGSLTGSGSLWLAFSLWLSLALYCSLWLPLALSATLWRTLALSHYSSLLLLLYTVLAWLTRPFLNSQRCCHADTLYPGLQQMYLFKTKVRKSNWKKTFVLIPTHKTRPDVVVRMCTYSKLNDTPKLQ